MEENGRLCFVRGPGGWRCKANVKLGFVARQTECNMRVGFIGLGAMGKGMAKNLVKAGFTVVVYDVRKEPIEELENLGAVSVLDLQRKWLP